LTKIVYVAKQFKQTSFCYTQFKAPLDI